MILQVYVYAAEIFPTVVSCNLFTLDLDYVIKIIISTASALVVIRDAVKNVLADFFR